MSATLLLTGRRRRRRQLQLNSCVGHSQLDPRVATFSPQLGEQQTIVERQNLGGAQSRSFGVDDGAATQTRGNVD